MLTKEMILGLIAATIAFCAGAQTPNHCPAVVIINHTEKWTKNDQRVLETASKRCAVIYEDAPCLKKFDKLDELRYTALCGN